MDKRLYGLTFAMVLTAGIAASNFPAAAQVGPAMGKKWAETCLSERTKPAYREALERIKLGGSSTSIGEAMVACCRRQNTADSACKNVEKDQGGRTNCEQGLKTCQTIVNADPGVKADLDKAKADKEKADKAKASTAGSGGPQQQQPTLPSARQVADGWQKQLEQAEKELRAADDEAKNAKTQGEATKALQKAYTAWNTVQSLRKRLGEQQANVPPAQRINYTSKLPPDYDKKPIDVVYTAISDHVCGKGRKAGWDGNIFSCQKGENPGENDRPIPPATDPDPKDPNRR
jgi:hypothetical protein